MTAEDCSCVLIWNALLWSSEPVVDIISDEKDI